MLDIAFHAALVMVMATELREGPLLMLKLKLMLLGLSSCTTELHQVALFAVHAPLGRVVRKQTKDTWARRHHRRDTQTL